ncbi:hypothetical protein PFTANZ_03761 [Plasmodium falciparum Tanzania (2000708)]|uniref:Uncharacterized protein n=1 Tax=Plasmodium falciparum Tanzania (2000708) TaxID=1036725 RepID=A0A024W4B8_PLAFA|nr:hypothetical protein PFTANZ_03761 [Plasmodium falciparum Tanzania (2000708)]
MAGQSEKKRLKKASTFIIYASAFFSIFSYTLWINEWNELYVLHRCFNIVLFFIFKYFLSSPFGSAEPSKRMEKMEKKKNKVVYKTVY